MTDVDSARNVWAQEKEKYHRLACIVEDALVEKSREQRIYVRCSARRKETDSLLKKMIKKQLSYEQVTDKAGARVIVRFGDDVERVASIVESTFTVAKRDDKFEALPYNKVGYLATHFDVELKREQANGDDSLLGLLCEIQIHTVCQNLWSDMAHFLSYKPEIPVPDEVNRRIHLLAAMLEVADHSFTDIHKTVQRLPGMEDVALLSLLEREFHRLAGRDYDIPLSQDVVSHLRPLYSPEEIEKFEQLIGEFVKKNESKLKGVYAIYTDSPESVLFLFQPEGLLILERLEKNLHQLEETWLERFPRRELEDLARAWGKPLD